MELYFGKLNWWLDLIPNSVIMVDIHRSMHRNRLSHYLFRLWNTLIQCLVHGNASCVCVCVCVRYDSKRKSEIWNYICHTCKDISQGLCKKAVIPLLIPWTKFIFVICIWNYYRLLHISCFVCFVLRYCYYQSQRRVTYQSICCWHWTLCSREVTLRVMGTMGSCQWSLSLTWSK